jgi:hypothetical protein
MWSRLFNYLESHKTSGKSVTLETSVSSLSPLLGGVEVGCFHSDSSLRYTLNTRAKPILGFNSKGFIFVRFE